MICNRLCEYRQKGPEHYNEQRKRKQDVKTNNTLFFTCFSMHAKKQSTRSHGQLRQEKKKYANSMPVVQPGLVKIKMHQC